MNGIVNFVKNWALIIALLIGSVGNKFFVQYADKTVYLILSCCCSLFAGLILRS